MMYLESMSYAHRKDSKSLRVKLSQIVVSGEEEVSTRDPWST